MKRFEKRATVNAFCKVNAGVTVEWLDCNGGLSQWRSDVAGRNPVDVTPPKAVVPEGAMKLVAVDAEMIASFQQAPKADRIKLTASSNDRTELALAWWDSISTGQQAEMRESAKGSADAHQAAAVLRAKAAELGLLGCRDINWLGLVNRQFRQFKAQADKAVVASRIAERLVEEQAAKEAALKATGVTYRWQDGVCTLSVQTGQTATPKTVQSVYNSINTLERAVMDRGAMLTAAQRAQLEAILAR